MKQDFTVYIRKKFCSNEIEIIISKEENGKLYVAEPVKLVFREYEEGGILEPTLRLNHFLAPKFLKALAEALDRENIKTDNDFKIKGLLEAKQEHLDDMRKIVNVLLGIASREIK